MPKNLTIRKIIAMVNALAKLHNFCIDEQERGTNASPQQCMTESSSDIDEFHITATHPSGYVSLERCDYSHDDDARIPIDLLDSGHHFRDIPRSARRNRNTDSLDGQVMLPRALLHEKVIQSHKVRPVTSHRA